MAAKKTAKKAPAKKQPAKEVDPAIMGKVTVMVKHGRSMEAVQELIKEAKITNAKAYKIVSGIQQG